MSYFLVACMICTARPVGYPTAMPSGSDLVLLHADGTEEVLFAAARAP